MEWLKSKTTMVAGGCLALIGLQGYGMMSMREAMEDRVAALEHRLETMRAEENPKIAQLASDLNVITQRMGITSQELQQSRALADQLKKENAQTAERFRRELAAKADARTLIQYREETVNRLNEVQKDAEDKVAGVSGEVEVVRTDLAATRDDLANSKRDLNTLIARNSTELAELRRRGERNYIEFDVRKSKNFQRIGDVSLQLKKTDVKKQKYDVVINSDDAGILKKDRTANEPITFLVGRDSARYEIVVNYVDKDRIRGYLSTPKDKLVASEGPTLRRFQ